jgi:hypothetical protein
VSDQSDALAELGVEAYTYLYPLVIMDLTRRQAVNAGSTLMTAGPMNTFVHVRELPPADFRGVVRPNFDTLYSLAWLDLTSGPVVLSSAAVTDGRYYELPMYDMWTDEFAAPGSRTTGAEAGNWAVVPPGWTGELPPGVDRIDSPTPYVWIIIRTETRGPADYPAVHAIQDGYSITPLANWGGEAPPARAVPDESIDMATPPLLQMRAMKAADFFTYAMRLLALHPPHLTDWALVEQMRRIGLVANAEFAALDAEVRSTLEGAPEAGQQAMQAAIPRIAHIVNGWQMNVDSIGVYGNFYMKRAIVAMLGLGSNAAEDAVYPLLLADADGNAISGDNDYILHFDADKLPPVRSFWSATVYDADGFPVANELNRFALGDRDPLHYKGDGSLDLYVQHQNPGQDKQANWLPAPKGPFSMLMRLYLPTARVLYGEWAPPPLRKQ